MLALSPGHLFQLFNVSSFPGEDEASVCNVSIMYAGESIFDENKQQTRKSAKMTLLDEENSGDLFIPSGVRSGKSAAAEDDEDIFKTEDNSDLLE